MAPLVARSRAEAAPRGPSVPLRLVAPRPALARADGGRDGHSATVIPLGGETRSKPHLGLAPGALPVAAPERLLAGPVPAVATPLGAPDVRLAAAAGTAARPRLAAVAAALLLWAVPPVALLLFPPAEQPEPPVMVVDLSFFAPEPEPAIAETTLAPAAPAPEPAQRVAEAAPAAAEPAAEAAPAEPPPPAPVAELPAEPPAAEPPPAPPPPVVEAAPEAPPPLPVKLDEPAPPRPHQKPKPKVARAAPVETPAPAASAPTAAPPAAAAEPAAAAAPPAPLPPPLAATQVATAYQSVLLARLERYKDYPHAARLRHVEGRALLRLRIARDGKVLDAHLVERSGSDLLDQATLQMAQRANPLPPLPAEVAGAVADFVVPVVFSLRS